jgi:prefoldin subunit 5
MDLDDKTCEQYQIVSVGENYLTFRKLRKTIEFLKFDNGDIDIEIQDDEILSYTFNKDQIKALITWIQQ